MKLAAGDVVEIPFPNGEHARIWVIEVDESGVQLLVLDGDAPAKATGGPLLPGYDDVWKGWFRGRIPADFAVVATRKPTAAAKKWVANASGTMIFGTAERLRDELFRDWRWKHDRGALEAEWAAADAEREQRGAARRAAMTLPKMLREKIFAGWDVPRRTLTEVRRIFRDATAELIALEKKGTRAQRVKVLKRITTELNALDDTQGFIETGEAELLVNRIEELARLVGVTNKDEALTGHRDW